MKQELRINEVMIGDWVHSKLHNVDTKIECIGDEPGLETRFHCVWLTSKECWERHYLDEIEPIILTPEILEKNGFIHYTDFYMWKEESLEPIHLDNYDEDGWRLRINCDNIPCECKYVHQLQHALRLCGIDKEIVI